MAECKFCHGGIEWRKADGKSVPYNLDGSPHRCKTESKTEGSQYPRVTGRITGYEGSNVRVGDKVLFLTPESRKSTQENYPVGTVVRAAHEKGTCKGMEIANAAYLEAFLKEEETQREKQPPPEIKTPQKPAPQQETRTSRESSAPAEKPDTFSEREEFCNLLTSTGREGMPALLQYLVEKTDFFTAPSSAKHHDAVPGGLLHHSLKTYRYLVTLSRTFAVDCPDDSLKIIGLLHDLCKVNFYVTTTRNVKKKDKSGFSEWVEEPFIDIEDQLPLGHGEKSVIMLQRYIHLTDTEIMGIRWHMMSYDDVAHSYAGNLAITNASSKHSIIPLMHIADLSASFLEVRPAGAAS